MNESLKKKNYQKTLHKFQTAKPPGIPNINIFLYKLKEITLNFGPDLITGGSNNLLINIEKSDAQGELLQDFIRFQKIRFPFADNPILTEYFVLQEKSKIKLSSGLSRPSYPSLKFLRTNTTNDIKPILIDLLFNDKDVKAELTELINEVIREEYNRVRPELKEELLPVESLSTQLLIRLSQTTENRKSDIKEEIESKYPSIFNDKIKSILIKEFPDSSFECWTPPTESDQSPYYIVKRGNKHLLIEIKEKFDLNDLSHLIKKGKLYRSMNPVQVFGCVIIVEDITPETENSAKKCNIRILLAKKT